MPKLHTLFFAAAGMLLFLNPSVATADHHGGKGKIKVLLIDGQNNHDWRRCSPVMTSTLEASGKFSVHRETVTEADVIDWIVDFTAYDVILSNYNGKAWQEKTQKAFVKYIEEGGNLVAVSYTHLTLPTNREV